MTDPKVSSADDQGAVGVKRLHEGHGGHELVHEALALHALLGVPAVDEVEHGLEVPHIDVAGEVAADGVLEADLEGADHVGMDFHFEEALAFVGNHFIGCDAP